MKLSSLYLLFVVVFVFSLLFGCWRADTPFKAIVLIDNINPPQEAELFLFMISFMLIIEIIGATIIFIVSYYSGKEYKLSFNSALIPLILLTCLITCGALIGHFVRWISTPELRVLLDTTYVLSMILGNLLLPLSLSFAGLFAGNYRRELLINRKNRARKQSNSN